MSYFRAENISLHFGGLKAVDAVSFAVEKGEILSIIGPNGAGKSSIFNLISRIYTPTSGKIFFEDQDITEVPAYGIAQTRHRPHVPEHRAVRECMAAKALDVVDEVQGRVVGWRNLSVGWQEVEVAVLSRLLAMSDDGEQESRFIVRGPLERRSDCFLRLGDRRVDHKSRRVKRR